MTLYCFMFFIEFFLMILFFCREVKLIFAFLGNSDLFCEVAI